MTKNKGEFKITKFNLKKYLKDQKLKISNIGCELGYSPQAYNYHLNKGELTFAFVEVVSFSTGKLKYRILKELIKDYCC